MNVHELLATGEAFADAVDALEAAGLHAFALRDYVTGLQRHLDRITVAHARALQRSEAIALHAGTGKRSVAEWLSSTTGSSRGETAGKLRLAETLQRSPVLAAAVSAGEVSPATARTLSDVVAHPPAGADVAELVTLVKGTDPRQAQRCVEQWKQLHSTETEDEFRERCHQARSLVFTTPIDGMVNGVFSLPVLEARPVQAAIGHLAGKPSDTDTRSTQQRLADGLILLADAYIKGEPMGGRSGPTVLVNVSLDALSGRSDAPGVTTWGDLVPASEVRQLLEHSVVRTASSGAGEAMSLGRRMRLASDAQWHALVARDGGCRWDGCEIPAEWCDVDHFVGWEQGGATDLSNLWLLCRHHHTEKHRPGVAVLGTVHDATVVLPGGLAVRCSPRPLIDRVHWPPMVASVGS
jgi:hypothetical protein